MELKLSYVKPALLHDKQFYDCVQLNHYTGRILSTEIEYRSGWLGLWRSAFACVGWQVTLCDTIWQVSSVAL